MAKKETKLVLFLKSIGISGRYKGFYYLKEAVFLVLQDEHCLCTVSYTHLDVYKRQLGSRLTSPKTPICSAQTFRIFVSSKSSRLADTSRSSFN